MRGHATIFIFLIIAFGCDTASNIKPPDKNYFVKYFGGDGNQYAVGLIANNDGTFFILGNSRRSAGALQKIYLAKADARGKVIWQTTYGNAEMQARDFVVANGTIVVAANRSPSAGSTDIQLLRFSLNGIPSDSAFLQMASTSTRVNSITVLNDGGFLVSGNTNDVSKVENTQDALHIRTDQNFNRRVISWMDTYGPGTSNDEVKGFQLADSIYVFGSTNAHYTTPTTSDQNFWDFSLHYSSGATDGNSDDNSLVDSLREDIVTHIERVSFGGGYLMVGISKDNTQIQNLKIIKLGTSKLAFNSTDLQLTYSPRSLGVASNESTPFATACNSLTGYLVLANSYNANKVSDMMLIKLYSDYASQTLKELWSEPVLLGGDGEDTAAAVAELADGHIIVLGTMNMGDPAKQFKIALMKLNSNGGLSE